MKPMGAAGLALAGSIGGGVQMVLTIREVGWGIFFDLLKSRYTLYFLIGTIALGAAFYTINPFLLHLIR